MTAERIDLSALRVGDKVTLTFEVVRVADSHGRVAVKHQGHDGALYPFNTYHGTVERAPRPLEVGDRVWWHNVPASIVAIVGDQAWVQFASNGDSFVTYLSNLTREASHD